MILVIFGVLDLSLPTPQGVGCVKSRGKLLPTPHAQAVHLESSPGVGWKCVSERKGHNERGRKKPLHCGTHFQIPGGEKIGARQISATNLVPEKFGGIF